MWLLAANDCRRRALAGAEMIRRSIAEQRVLPQIRPDHEFPTALRICPRQLDLVDLGQDRVLRIIPRPFVNRVQAARAGIGAYSLVHRVRQQLFQRPLLFPPVLFPRVARNRWRLPSVVARVVPPPSVAIAQRIIP